VIGTQVAIGDRPHWITLQDPGEPIPDGAGGYTEGWTDLNPPHLFVRIQNATVADLERAAAGTVITSATHIVSGPYHPGVSTKTRVQFVDLKGRTRILSVTGIGNRDERNIDMVLTCEERV
jgi:head-tail adaptor